MARSLETTRLVAVELLAILDVLLPIGKPHDTLIGWQVGKPTRENAAVDLILGETDYDSNTFASDDRTPKSV